MAYYTALITAWNAGTVPSGVVGTALTGLPTAQKLINVNAWTVTGSIPTSFFTTGAQILNCINWAEFNALTAQQQSNVLALCKCDSILGGSGNVAFIGPGMIVAYFPVAGPTVAALSALASEQVQPWWGVAVANGGAGLSSPVSNNDLAAAGLS